MRFARRPRDLGDSAAMLLLALTTVLMLQAIRVFVAYLIFVVDQSKRLELGAIVFAVFLATGLASVLQWAIGARRLLVVAVGLLLSGRLGLQFIDQPDARVALAAVAVTTWGWVLIGAYESRPAPYGFGIGLGLLLDLVIRIGLLTRDPPWMPALSDHLLTFGIVTAALLALRAVAREPLGPARTGAAFPLVAIGPCLAAYHLLTGNLGFAHVALGTFPSAAAVLAFSLSTGLLLAVTLADVPPVRRVQRLAPSAFVIFGMSALWLLYDSPNGQEGRFTLVSLFASTGVALGLFLAVDGRPRFAGRARPGTSFWVTFGLVAQAALLFAYYTATGSATVVAIVGMLLAGCALAAAPRPAPARTIRQKTRLWLLVTLGATVVTGVRWASWTSPAPGEPIASQLTVLTWNLQSGFARDNHWDLEAQARVIESQRPDIVILQEVSRGWLATTSADQLLWLSRRLDMPYAWGPASDDDLWGNAILSRAPLSDVAVLRYRSTQNLKRSAVRARVATTRGDVWVIATHLDNPSGAGAVRLEQAAQLIAFRGERAPAIVAGDLNATPDSDVIATIVASGLVDSGAILGPSAATAEDGRRIDYILATPDLELMATRIVETDASDHRPVVAVYHVVALAQSASGAGRGTGAQQFKDAGGGLIRSDCAHDRHVQHRLVAGDTGLQRSGIGAVDAGVPRTHPHAREMVGVTGEAGIDRRLPVELNVRLWEEGAAHVGRDDRAGPARAFSGLEHPALRMGSELRGQPVEEHTFGHLPGQLVHLRTECGDKDSGDASPVQRADCIAHERQAPAPARADAQPETVQR